MSGTGNHNPTTDIAEKATGYSQGFIRGYYRLLALSYDLTLTAFYAGTRRRYASLLKIPQGAQVLVLGCGTGADFEWIEESIGPQGSIVGVDYTPEMLAKAEKRVAKRGYANVQLIEGDGAAVGPELLGDAMPSDGQFDAVVANLALSVIPAWRQAFARSWSLLRPGGRYGILDGYGKSGPIRWMAPLLDAFAASDIRRPTWELLDGPAEAIERDTALFRYLHMTVGTKPAH